MTPESRLQSHFKTAIRKAGGKSYKFVSPANRGVSDQIVWVPGGITVYTEIKDGDKKLSPLQQVFQRDCQKFGMPHEVIRFEEDILLFVEKYFPNATPDTIAPVKREVRIGWKPKSEWLDRL